jgi:hypothetical protein
LDYGEAGGERQIEQGNGLTVDLDFESGVAEAAEDQHNTKRGEGEQEHDR